MPTSHSATKLMGVLNVTPDSFSDGALYCEHEAAFQRGLEMWKQGASLIDVGGESTRPGAKLVGAAEEQRRAVPVVKALSEAGVTVSIDTISSETAKAAVEAGAQAINDVSGGLHDAQMYKTVASLQKERKIVYIIGHWLGIPDPNNKRSNFDDVVSEVREALLERALAAQAAGVKKELIVLDPGLGFDKNVEQSWQLLTEIDKLKELGFPVCVGVSRKRMMGDVVADVIGDHEFAERDLATAITTAFAAQAKIDFVRVHDVAGSKQALSLEKIWARKESSWAVNKDKITLTGLEVFAHHGVFDFERENGQRFLIDVEVTTSMTPAIVGDDLSNTVHYGELAEKIVAAAQTDPVDLIETLAHRVARVALSFAAALNVKVTVHKPEAPIQAVFGDVSVTIERNRSSLEEP